MPDRGQLSGAGKRPAAHARFQRCAVRVTYTRNATRGSGERMGGTWRVRVQHWKRTRKELGFNEARQGIDIADRLETWQSNGDRLFWKLILSPEFGDWIDLERLTRDVMKDMEKDLGSKLEWVPVAHHNTEHPHVHVALRGIRDDGQSLQLDRRYIKEGIRAVAEDYCSRQIGYRTDLDAAEAERREVQEKRFTSLDRIILRRGEDGSDATWLHVSTPPASDQMHEPARVQGRHVAARLAVLSYMGLAVADDARTWRVRRDFESVLRAMQRTADRQKMLAAHGVLMSDERLPIEMLDRRHMTAVEGRILVHGEDEITGRNYLMLEGTDAKVHLIHHTPEMKEARSRGGLRAKS